LKPNPLTIPKAEKITLLDRAKRYEIAEPDGLGRVPGGDPDSGETDDKQDDRSDE
jgi:hypothetical protein